MSTIAFFQSGHVNPAAPDRKIAQAETVSGEPLLTELIYLDALIRVRSDWASLAARALEPNIFLEPAFAIPLFQHCLNKTKAGFLLTWAPTPARASAEEASQPRGQLLGLLPLALPIPLLSCFARGLTHRQAPLGTPLFDRDHGSEALHHMMGWIEQNLPEAAGLIISDLPLDGATFALLQNHAAARRNQLILLQQSERAVLTKTVAGDAFPNRFISAKRRKHYRQQRRRLKANGEVNYRTISDAGEMRQATEAFLSLEFKGWKGSRKTALLANSAETTFFRSMTRLMALEGKCRIDSLEVDGSPIAMGIILTSGERALYWKTTYDERFAPLSPGVQLTLELTQTQLAMASLSLTDSCAISNHPMIDHIWRERLKLANVLLPIRPRGIAFAIGLSLERMHASARRMAKTMLQRFARRRRNRPASEASR